MVSDDSEQNKKRKRNFHPEEEAFNKRRDVCKHHFVLSISFSEFENRTFRKKKNKKKTLFHGLSRSV